MENIIDILYSARSEYTKSLVDDRICNAKEADELVMSVATSKCSEYDLDEDSIEADSIRSSLFELASVAFPGLWEDYPRINPGIAR